MRFIHLCHKEDALFILNGLRYMKSIYRLSTAPPPTEPTDCTLIHALNILKYKTPEPTNVYFVICIRSLRENMVPPM